MASPFLHDAMVTTYVFSRAANDALVRATLGVVSVTFRNFSVALARGGGVGGVA